MINRWTRRRIVYEFAGFPKCIAKVIAEYLMIPHLLQWIDPGCLDTISICGNPGAIESGMISDMKFCDIEWLGRNPAAAEYIKSQPLKFLHCNSRWANAALFDWMIEHAFNQTSYLKWDNIRNNPNPDAIGHILENNPDGIGGISLSNPSITMCGSWEYIMSEMSDRYELIYANPSAIADGVCGDFCDDTYGYLSANPHSIAIEYLRTHQNKINWHKFSMNPGIFEYRVDPELLAALSE